MSDPVRKGGQVSPKVLCVCGDEVPRSLSSGANTPKMSWRNGTIISKYREVLRVLNEERGDNPCFARSYFLNPNYFPKNEKSRVNRM